MPFAQLRSAVRDATVKSLHQQLSSATCGLRGSRNLLLASTDRQSATGTPRVLSHKLLDLEIPKTLGQAFGETEMQLTNGFGVALRHVDKWAASEDELHSAALINPNRAKASACYLGFEQISGLSGSRQLGRPTMTVLATHLARVLITTHRIAQKAGQPRIGA